MITTRGYLRIVQPEDSIFCRGQDACPIWAPKDQLSLPEMRKTHHLADLKKLTSTSESRLPALTAVTDLGSFVRLKVGAVG